MGDYKADHGVSAPGAKLNLFFSLFPSSATALEKPDQLFLLSFDYFSTFFLVNLFLEKLFVFKEIDQIDHPDYSNFYFTRKI